MDKTRTAARAAEVTISCHALRVIYIFRIYWINKTYFDLRFCRIPRYLALLQFLIIKTSSLLLNGKSTKRLERVQRYIFHRHPYGRNMQSGGRSEGWWGGLMLLPLPKGGGGTKISWSASQSVTATSGLIVEEYSTTTSLLVPRREGRSNKRSGGSGGISGNYCKRKLFPLSSFTVTFFENMSRISSTSVHSHSLKMPPFNSPLLFLWHDPFPRLPTCIFYVWLFSVKYSQ